jgi:hypothetical protein
MDPGAQTLGRFRIDSALSHNASERGLNMLPRAAETIVQIEMAERSIKIIPPQKIDDSAAEPDALRITGRPADLRGGFGELIGPFLGILVGIAGLAGLWCLVARLGIAALGKGPDRGRKRDRSDERDGKNTREEGHDRAGFYGRW